MTETTIYNRDNYIYKQRQQYYIWQRQLYITETTIYDRDNYNRDNYYMTETTIYNRDNYI